MNEMETGLSGGGRVGGEGGEESIDVVEEGGVGDEECGGAVFEERGERRPEVDSHPTRHRVKDEEYVAVYLQRHDRVDGEGRREKLVQDGAGCGWVYVLSGGG